MSQTHEVQHREDGWMPHSEDLETWMIRANPHFNDNGRTLCSAFRGMTVYLADVQDAVRFADDPEDPISVAQKVVDFVSLRYRLARSPFDVQVIENEP